MRILVRTRGGGDYGWGHVVRMRTLAQKIRAADPSCDIRFVLEGAEAAADHLRAVGFPVTFRSCIPDIASERGLWPFDGRADFGFVDMLQVPCEVERLLADSTDRLVLFDDLGGDEHLASCVVRSQMLGGVEIERVEGGIVLNGPKYFILQEEYIALRSEAKLYPPVAKRALISLGGSAPAELTEIVVRGVSSCGSLRSIEVMCGFESESGSYGRLKLIDPRVELVADEGSMPQRLFATDIAVLAGGFVKYEAAAVGTPALLVSIVEHQEQLGRDFTATGAAEYVGRLQDAGSEMLSRALKGVAVDSRRRETMGMAGKRLVDGRGAERVLAACAGNHAEERIHHGT